MALEINAYPIKLWCDLWLYNIFIYIIYFSERACGFSILQMNWVSLAQGQQQSQTLLWIFWFLLIFSPEHNCLKKETTLLISRLFHLYLEFS